MTEILEFAFHKGGIAGLIAVLAVVALLRVYKENREHVKGRHSDKTKFHEEFTKAQVAWKDEVIRIKDACEGEIKQLLQQQVEITDKLLREQNAQRAVDGTQYRDLARGKIADSRVLRDVQERLRELEDKQRRNTPRPPSGGGVVDE